MRSVARAVWIACACAFAGDHAPLPRPTRIACCGRRRLAASGDFLRDCRELCQRRAASSRFEGGGVVLQHRRASQSEVVLTVGNAHVPMPRSRPSSLAMAHGVSTTSVSHAVPSPAAIRGDERSRQHGLNPIGAPFSRLLQRPQASATNAVSWPRLGLFRPSEQTPRPDSGIRGQGGGLLGPRRRPSSDRCGIGVRTTRSRTKAEGITRGTSVLEVTPDVDRAVRSESHTAARWMGPRTRKVRPRGSFGTL